DMKSKDPPPNASFNGMATVNSSLAPSNGTDFNGSSESKSFTATENVTQIQPDSTTNSNSFDFDFLNFDDLSDFPDVGNLSDNMGKNEKLFMDGQSNFEMKNDHNNEKAGD